MRCKSIIYSLLFVGGFASSAMSQEVNGLVEFGTAIHGGDNTPLWQASMQQGLSSIDNNCYLRGAVFYADTLKNWRLEAGADMAVGAGMTSVFIPQQYYVGVSRSWYKLWAGARELWSPLLDSELSSGGLTWSGNARPIPQVMLCTPGYVSISRRVAVKAELSFGWFTDGNYQQEHTESRFVYNKKMKYHHKSLLFRFGLPEGKWMFDVGMDMDAQFGGYMTKEGETHNLGNGLREYWRALTMRNEGEGLYYSGNLLGTEYLRLSYGTERGRLALYLLNFFDDLSGMGKRNGMDGLWGVEYSSKESGWLTGAVLEYYQTTNQSGPLHGLDGTEVKKTGGADDYYNNDQFSGWAHWGVTMANPLLLSPVYNSVGTLSLTQNRVRAVHLGVKGQISKRIGYRCRFSFNRSWGTPFKPNVNIKNNFSTFAEINYIAPKLKDWHFTASVAGDSGELYGDNVGVQLKVRKRF